MVENVDSMLKEGPCVCCPSTETSDMLNCIAPLIVSHTSVHMLAGFWCSLIGCSGLGKGLEMMYTIKVDTFMNVIQMMQPQLQVISRPNVI
jgi:hypothetical protein